MGLFLFKTINCVILYSQLTFSQMQDNVTTFTNTGYFFKQSNNLTSIKKSLCIHLTKNRACCPIPAQLNEVGNLFINQLFRKINITILFYYFCSLNLCAHAVQVCLVQDTFL